MSIVLNMVGGGGGLNVGRPLIHVNAPVGSTVTFTLSRLIVKSITPDKAFTNSDGVTADYYYSSPANGTYTVTATLGTDTTSGTVIVSENKQYDLSLSYSLILFNNGTETVTWGAYARGGGAQGWSGVAPTVTANTGYYTVSFPANAGSIFSTADAHDLTGYSTLKALIRHDSAFAQNISFIFGAFDRESLTMNGMADAAAKADLGGTNTQEDVTVSVDVSSVSGSYNVGFAHYAATTDVVNYLKKVWLER